jgi:hypothetical protein
MRIRLFAPLGFAPMIGLILTLAAPSVGAQSPTTTKTTAAKAYTAPRTPDGQPDLQGVWANNAATPVERPKELEGRATLTEAEVAALKKRAGELFNGETDAAFGDSVFTAALKDAKTFKSTDTQTGNYNHFWIVDRNFENRTSLVTDPPDGKIPALTPDAQKRQDASVAYKKEHPADGPEDLPLTHRCVTFGVPNIFAGYNSYYQIIQSKDHVAIASEMIHDVRIIPLDNRPHVGSNTRLWLGDSRGHWEGNTLVVETTNFNNHTNFISSKTNGSLENMRLVERFTRVGPTTLQYDITVTDPTTWTKPWSASLFWTHSAGQIYEYACHEGNEGLEGALSGTRFQEKAALATATKGSQ